MLYAGRNIQSSSDKLQKITEEYLYHSLTNPKPEIRTKIKQLRIVRQLDETRYKLLKRQLPYIVCASFNPCIRKTENFVYTDTFLVDIDHIHDKSIDIEVLKKQIAQDERVVLLFKSPSNDGLKILFRLSERCYDSGIYRVFYKSFVCRFGEELGIDQVIDSKTCDVTRACFISIDEHAYYNPNAVPVKTDAYIDMENSVNLFDTKREIEKEIKDTGPVDDDNHCKDPDEDTLKKIKATLSLRKKQIKYASQDIYVPEQLNEIIQGLKEYIEKQGITLYEIQNIQYAKKLKLQLGVKKAEINLFYGKRGFNVVKSPKCGMSKELNDITAELIEMYLESES